MQRTSINRRPPAVLAAVAITIGGIAAGATVAVAAQHITAPAGTSATPDGQITQGADVSYPTNDAGQTYGVADVNVDYNDWPDLISVVATNGQEGYVNRAELGSMIGADVSTPDEALAWQASNDAATWNTKQIPAFESDGATMVGSFEITRSIEVKP